MLRRLLIVAAFFCVSKTLHAQRSELGFGIGTFNYTGDLVRNYNLKYSKPAATVFFRSNLSKVVSFRASITAGKIGASEIPIDSAAILRDASFDLFLFEFSKDSCLQVFLKF